MTEPKTDCPKCGSSITAPTMPTLRGEPVRICLDCKKPWVVSRD